MISEILRWEEGSGKGAEFWGAARPSAVLRESKAPVQATRHTGKSQVVSPDTTSSTTTLSQQFLSQPARRRPVPPVPSSRAAQQPHEHPRTKKKPENCCCKLLSRNSPQLCWSPSGCGWELLLPAPALLDVSPTVVKLSPNHSSRDRIFNIAS